MIEGCAIINLTDKVRKFAGKFKVFAAEYREKAEMISSLQLCRIFCKDKTILATNCKHI
jgi:hypothetical protein